jgi:hypothetical protein
MQVYHENEDMCVEECYSICTARQTAFSFLPDLTDQRLISALTLSEPMSLKPELQVKFAVDIA